MEQLSKLHNLMMNCTSKEELRAYCFNIVCSYTLNDKLSAVFQEAMKNPVLAASKTVLPIYYFTASTSSGMKQDRFGKFYKAA